MKKCIYTAAALLLAVSLMPAQAFSKGKGHNNYHHHHGTHHHFAKDSNSGLFQHVGSFDVMDGNGSGVAEIESPSNYNREANRMASLVSSLKW